MSDSAFRWTSNAMLIGINVYAFWNTPWALLAGFAIGYVVAYDLLRKHIEEARRLDDE